MTTKTHPRLPPDLPVHLAVMNLAATDLHGMSPPLQRRAQELREARAAVAELVQAGKVLRERTRIAVLRVDEPNPVERFDAALAAFEVTP